VGWEEAGVGGIGFVCGVFGRGVFGCGVVCLGYCGRRWL
jgi:hypothetical protein